MQRAMICPGRAWHVGALIWFLCGLQKSNPVLLRSKVLRDCGLSRNTVRRGLACLEAADLVSVEQRAGKLRSVTILSPNGESTLL